MYVNRNKNTIVTNLDVVPFLACWTQLVPSCAIFKQTGN